MLPSIERDQVDRSPRSKAGHGEAGSRWAFRDGGRGKDGKPRYTAYSRDLRGREASAGTFARKAGADAAWHAAEAGARADLRHDPGRGRQRFGHYAEAMWLPHHRMELAARVDYTPAVDRHLLWFFGPVKMRDSGQNARTEHRPQQATRPVCPIAVRTDGNTSCC